MKQFRTIIASLGIITALFAGSIAVLPAQQAFAAPAKTPAPTTSQQAACEAINGKSGCTKGGDLSKVVKIVINVMSVVIGVIAVIMIMVAGYKYITSGGESGKVTSAKNTLVYAIVGLVIVALAQFMVRVVLKQAKTVTLHDSVASVSVPTSTNIRYRG